MCQEAEEGVWKPVLGTLGIASVFLSMLGNLVFPPDSLLEKGGSDTGEHLAATSIPQSLDPSRAESEPVSVFQEAVEHSSIPMPKLPDAQEKPQVKSAPQVEPAEVAEQAPQVELLPKTDPTVVTLPVESPTLPDEFVLPNGKAGPGESAPDVSVADVRPDTEQTLPDDVREQHPRTVAALEPSPPVVPQNLSHYDRKVLRKATRLEKKKIRLVKAGRSIVWR